MKNQNPRRLKREWEKNKDVSLTAMILFLKCCGLWMANNRAEERMKNIAVVFMTCSLIFVTWILIMDAYRARGEFSQTMYATCNIFTLAVVLCKFIIILVNNKKFSELLRHAQQNFWHSNYDSYENELLIKCQHTSTLLIYIFSICTESTALSYSFVPIFENIGKNESDRMLPFNMWISVPTYMTPSFEIIFTVQCLAVSHVGICYLCVDNFLCVMNLHVVCQFRILRYRLEKISKIIQDEEKRKSLSGISSHCASLCYAKFKNCIKQHQSLIEFCNNLEDVFTVILLNEILLFSLLICLDGYLLLQNGSVLKRSISLLHIVSCLCELLMLTYSCDRLIEESTKIGPTVYLGPWTHLPMSKDGRMMRKDVILVVMRSSIPCCLTGSGFFIVSLETYTRVLSTAVSYFTLLNSY